MMRTYSRKRSEYQFIDGVNEMCRLCLGKVQESVPIFSETNNVCSSLATRIMMCVGLEITQEDSLPDMICEECHKELNHYYEFKKKCVLSYQKLKSHVLATKQYGSEKLKLKDEIAVKEDNENSTSEINMLETKEEPNMLDNIVLYIQNPQEKPNGLNNLNNLCNGAVIATPSTESISEVHPDMTGFLSSILLELGVMMKHENQIVLLDESVKSIEIETSDDMKITLGMLEVTEEMQNENVNKNYIHTTIHNIELCNNNKKTGQSKGGDPCSMCGKRFASRSALRRHALVHTGERPHACAVCARAFSQREVLRRHELVHSERRPFQCSSCPKSFTQRGALAAHARAHAAPGARALALHRCARCPKVFLHASGLSRHTMMHNGRVFSCNSCERRFSDKSSLLRHVRAKHRLLAANDAVTSHASGAPQ